MCKECGCEASENQVIDIDRRVTEFNDLLAQQVSSRLKEMGILSINLMGAPGSGKTSVIEGLAQHVHKDEIAVIQGDLESDIDKKRLEKHGIETVQINTHSGCHLNSAMVNDALLELTLKGKRYLIIENVGNLVCPAGVKIGQHINIVVSSTAEGMDKPMKYPHIFLDSNLIIISKTDIAEAVDFDSCAYIKDLRKTNPKAEIAQVSKKEPESFSAIACYLEHERAHLLHSHHHH
jgi:hydrogenase nickel incorporation protein HypB